MSIFVFYYRVIVVTRQVPLYYYHTIRVPRVFLWNRDYPLMEGTMDQVMCWYDKEGGVQTMG